MRLVMYCPNVLGVLLAVVGCSGSSPATPPFAAVPGGSPQTSDGIDARKVIETLKAANVVVKVQSCISGSGTATFTATGKAKGKYRGKLAVTGGWNFVNITGESFWTFGETSKIKGKHPVTGTVDGNGTSTIATCKTFGPVNDGKDLTYHLGTWSGAPTMSEINNGANLLQKLPK